MQIHMEASDKHTIRSYDDTQITINDLTYNTSLVIGRQAIISPWPVHSVLELTESHIQTMLELQPEVIIIGHNQPELHIPIMLVQFLAKQRIGIECMSIGAASRTFNLLLSELRAVVAGIIFPIN